VNPNYDEIQRILQTSLTRTVSPIPQTACPCDRSKSTNGSASFSNSKLL